MTALGFQEVMGRMLWFMDTVTQAGLFPADPATSEAGGRAQTPTAQASGHVAAVYSGCITRGWGSASCCSGTRARPAADGDPQKLLDRWTRLHPPIFGGERHEDAQDFIVRCRDKLHNMRILESHGVDFTTFQLEGRAHKWYIPPSKREELRYQFEQLEQDQMSVTDYEVRFFELSRHALMILPTEAERVPRFVAGLHSGIRANMAREVEMGTPYQLVVEIARKIDGYHLRGREQSQQDKRARFSREFRGASARGRGQFGRGQPSRPPYSAPLPPRDAPARPYFSVILESSYRPPAIQSSSSGDASVLFDPGSTYSYVSSLFAHFLDIHCEPLGTPVHVSTPVGDSVVVDRIYRSCMVTFYGFKTRADLLLLDMTDFEVILDMDWLSQYHIVLDCHTKAVTVAMPELPRLEWKSSLVNTSSRVISFLKV
ncbi:uncharacterized protein [Nicotiana sylvestris]|uniref:uncharacterized protein n=1 Tax=Nicotiana sylvestris TaxID=4096 RepID=UPI00388CCA49